MIIIRLKKCQICLHSRNIKKTKDYPIFLNNKIWRGMNVKLEEGKVNKIKGGCFYCNSSSSFKIIKFDSLYFTMKLIFILKFNLLENSTYLFTTRTKP